MSAVIALSTVVASGPAADAATNCTFGAAHTPGDASTFIRCTVSQQPGPGKPVFGGGWTPPVCWIEPQFTGPELKVLVAALMGLGAVSLGGAGAIWVGQIDSYYNAMTPPYHVGDNGMFWGVACRTDDLTFQTAFQAEMAAAGLDDLHPWKWVPAGAPVNAPNPVTPELLAEYAAAQIVPPDVSFTVPSATQTVNLSTRVYASGGAAYNVITATATLAGIGSSQVQAVPNSVTVTPGGPANDMNGNPITTLTCPVAGGTFGSATSDACAFKYTKATTGTYPLSVSMTWTVNWVGNAGGVWPVTITKTANTQNLAVQEVQAVVGR